MSELASDSRSPAAPEAPAPRVVLAEAVAAFDGLPDGFFAVDRDFRLIALNRAAAGVFRLEREAALGRPLWTALPHLIGTELERRYRAAMRSGSGDRFVVRPPGRPEAQVEVRLHPFQDGLGVVFRDVSAQLEEQEESRATAAKLRLALQAGRMAVWEHDTPSDVLKASPELKALLGFSPEDALDTAEIRARFHRGDRERLRKAAAAALAAGEKFFESEVRLRAKDGGLRWLWMRAELTLGPDGAPAHTLGVVIDVTDRKRIEGELAEGQADLDAALKAGKLAIIDFDHRTGVFKPSARLNELYGYDPGRALTLDDVRARYHPEDVPRIRAWLARYLDDPGLVDWRWDFRLLLPGGEVRWIEGVGAYERAGDGTILRSRGVVQDITERKRWEEHQKLLIDELNHRVKNTLAVVQGLAQQSLRPGAAPEVAFDRFEARLTALAAAHSLLTRSHWTSTDLEEVARAAIEPALGEGLARVRLGGPKVEVRPQTALALSLALHELCTNALKHGALSRAEGSVDLDWTLGEGSPPVLRMVWRESGGPEVRSPESHGFGRRLLERALARELGGTVTLDFPASGATCTIEAPLTETAPFDDGVLVTGR